MSNGTGPPRDANGRVGPALAGMGMGGGDSGGGGAGRGGRGITAVHIPKDNTLNGQYQAPLLFVPKP